ncbi:MAG: putative 7-carboxy-7-deazaguanine synthase QueE [Oscillospiraceae bacterium]|nr:putative 7-carboxy-7-deazaguanine synthase QueE [Oscillospiraceae bacterium]
MLYPVAEKFVSINGEGKRAGELAVFIRFRKCNLKCSYCDTMWTNSEDCPVEMLTADEILNYIHKKGVTNVTLTGGEPLLQENIEILVEKLMKSGHQVEIETNGSISIKKLSQSSYRPSFTLDYKLPSSNMESFMLTENYDYLTKNDVVKFVAGNLVDLKKADEIIKKFSLTEKCLVYISPVFGKINPDGIVEFMKLKHLNQVRLQLQLHKLIWNPEERGV